MLTKANLDVASLCTSFPLQAAGLEARECFGLRDQTYAPVICFFTKWPGDLVIQFSSFMRFLNVIRDSARIEQLLTVVNSHHWSNLQTINSLCKRLLAEASSFAAPEN